MELYETIRKYALQNAVKFNGKVNKGAVVGKVLAEHPEVKDRMKEVSQEIQEVIEEIDALSPEDQKAALEDYKHELQDVKKEERDLFAFFKIGGPTRDR